MKTDKKQLGFNGYTIVEVMIFLAVSGLMFVMAAIFINGKQDKVAYHQGVTAAASSITNEINTVANGEFPSSSSLKCQAGGSGQPTFTNSASHQGENQGCVFLGKVLQFGTNSPDNTKYKSYTVVGRQFKDSPGSAVTSFADAQPVAISSSPSGASLVQTGVLEQGLTYTQAYLCETDCSSGHTSSIGGVGFFGSFNGQPGLVANSSGAQTVNVMAIPQTSNMTTEIGNFGTYGDSALLSDHQFIVACFKYGDKIGSVTIGGKGGQATSVSVQYGNQLGVCGTSSPAFAPAGAGSPSPPVPGGGGGGGSGGGGSGGSGGGGGGGGLGGLLCRLLPFLCP